MTDKQTSAAELEKYAQILKKELKAHKQNQVFRAAVEGGVLCALADGEVDAKEKEALMTALPILSAGLVLEWEVETLVEECFEKIGAEGPIGRQQSVGLEMKNLGQAEAALFVASVVAFAVGGIDKREAATL